jgi:hypothetical protein
VSENDSTITIESGGESVTMTAEQLEQAVELVERRRTITIPAHVAATAWLNAHSATSKEEDRPTLRALALEFFPRGVQFIGCDGTVLVRSWVPITDDDKPADFPTLDEAPSRSICLLDSEGFGASFMKALQRVTSEEGRSFEELSLTIQPNDEGATLALGEQFMTERLVLRACGQRTDLRLYEDAYVDWRKTRLGMEGIERVDSLTVAPRLLALIGKLKGIDAIDLEFYGADKHVAFVGRGLVEVRGILMPMRKREKPIEA